jgi:hypothetical protein
MTRFIAAEINKERNAPRTFGKLASPERFNAISKAGLSLECAVDDGALANAPAAIWPAERDVHKEIEHEKGLAAFRWAPKDAEADAWDQSFDEIGGRCVERDFVERDKLEARLAQREWLAGRKIIEGVFGEWAAHAFRLSAALAISAARPRRSTTITSHRSALITRTSRPSSHE